MLVLLEETSNNTSHRGVPTLKFVICANTCIKLALFNSVKPQWLSIFIEELKGI